MLDFFSVKKRELKKHKVDSLGKISFSQNIVQITTYCFLSKIAAQFQSI